MTIVKTVSCALDCPDNCRFHAYVEKGQIVRLIPDKNHPVTKGFSCRKGRAQVKKMNHPSRITTPLIRTAGGFSPVSYRKAIQLIAEKLHAIRDLQAPEAVLDYTGDGYGGMKSRIQTIFFNCFGGASIPEGSLCWGAGLAAQTYDFGAARGHDPDDILNADTIIVWGRNPGFTSLHLHALLKKASKKGSRVIVIDPLKTATAKEFDDFIQVRPATDGALALGMAWHIYKNNWVDWAFIKQHVLGGRRFLSYVKTFDPERVAGITGVCADTVFEISQAYATAKTATIYPGFGLQRYHNGGNTIRCIDALGAITGKIGKQGCGINYAAKTFGPYLSAPEDRSEKYIQNQRRFQVGRIGSFLKTAKTPRIDAAFVLGANPLTQSPDLRSVMEGFQMIDFKVVFERFMTDTAMAADIILPGVFSFEQEDIVVSGMYSPILNYSEQAVLPPKGVLSEFEFYLRLADEMGMQHLGFSSSSEFLQQCAQNLLDKENQTYQSLKTGYVRISGGHIPWDDRQFNTPSKKVELYSEKAAADGLSALPEYKNVCQAPADYPIRLLTTHARDSIHSQEFASHEKVPDIYLHPETAADMNLENKMRVSVTGARQTLAARLVVNDSICRNTALIYQGYWQQSGAVNFLTDDGVSDMGGQAAFYDSFCRIAPARPL